MQRRRLLVLASIAAVLGIYIAVWERHAPSTDERRASRHLLLPGLEPGEVKRLQLSGPAAPFALVREGDGWRLDPGGEAADTGTVDRLLAALRGAEIRRTLEPQAAEGVMKSGVRRIGVRTDAREWSLELGEIDGTGSGVFARVDGGPVRVTEARLRELAGRPRAAWREGRIFTVAPGDVTAVTWTSGGKTHVIRRDGDHWVDGQGTWMVDERANLAVAALVRLHGEHVEGTVEPSGEPRLSARVEAGGKVTELRLFAGGCSEDRLLLVSGKDRLCLDRAGAPEAALEMAMAPDARVMGVGPAQVTGITLVEGARRLELRRGPGGWTASGAAGPVGGEEIERWLGELSEVEATPVAVRAFPAGGARQAVIATAAGQRSLEVARSGGRVLVRRSGEGRVLTAPAALWDALAPDPRAFRPRLLLSSSRFDLRRLTVTEAGGSVAEVVREGDEWHLARPAGGELDRRALEALLGAVTELRAVRFLEESRLEPQRIVEIDEELPATRATAASHRVHRLELGRAGADGCRARIDTGDVALLAPETCAALGASLVSRAGAPPPALRAD